MKKKYIYACAVLSVLTLISWLFIHQMGKSEARVRKTTCMNNLHLIGRAIEGYRKNHDGNYPVSLEELHPKYLEDRRSLQCCAVFGGTPTNADYLSYIYFRPETSLGHRAVIVRDKPGNHSFILGYGVLYANGETAWVNE